MSEGNRTFWVTLLLPCFVFPIICNGCRQVPVVLAPSTTVQASAAAVPDEESTGVVLVEHEVVSKVKIEEKLAQPFESVIPQTLQESLPVEGQSVDYFVGVALAGHPRIRAARAKVSAASHRVLQVESLEDPLLSNRFYPLSDQALQTAAGRAGNTLSLAQKYPWPEKRWTKGAIAARETRVAAAKLTQAELAVEETVRLAYYELWFANQAIRITEQNRQLAVEIIKLAEARNAAGGSQQDVLRAQLQLDTLDGRLITLRRQKGIAQADLAALIQEPGRMGIEPTETIDVAHVPAQIEGLFAAAQASSPRLREYRWAVSRDRQKRRLACLEKYPDFVVGAGWQTMTETAAISPGANGHDNVNFMVGVTLPIWRQRIQASIREASAVVTASSRELGDASDDTFRQIRRLSVQASAANEQLRLTTDRILPRAQRALQLASADYRGQLVSFDQVTDSFTEVLMFELQIARTKASLAGLLAQLKHVIGCEVIAESNE